MAGWRNVKTGQKLTYREPETGRTKTCRVVSVFQCHAVARGRDGMVFFIDDSTERYFSING